MTEELKGTSPPVEARIKTKTPEELVAESNERTAIYEGSQVAEKGRRSLDYFASNDEAWRGIEPPEEVDNQTEHARHMYAIQQQKKILDSGGDLLIERGRIRHQALLPDNYGYKVPDLVYDFDGTGYSAHFALDEQGDPMRTIVYEVPKDSSKPRRIELFTREGNLEALSGTPEFEAIEKELVIEVGKGLRPAPKELTEQEAVDEFTMRSTLEDIRDLPETPEQS
ncbi:MAG: hypothetical protein ACREGG_01750 [Candidatus Saccharimonadales bacterium]